MITLSRAFQFQMKPQYIRLLIGLPVVSLLVILLTISSVPKASAAESADQKKGVVESEKAPVPSEVKEENEKKEDQGGLIESTAELADDTHEVLSDKISLFSDELDSFFGDERMDEETNTSKLRINIISEYDAAGNVTYKANIAATLILPRTQKKMNLVVEDMKESIADDDQSDGTRVSLKQNQVTDTVTETSLAAAMKFIWLDTGNWSIDTTYGCLVKYPLDPYAKLRVRRSIDLSNEWESRITQLVRWSYLYDWEELTGLTFDRPISKKMMFRFSNSIFWKRTTQLFNFSHGISLFHQLSHEKALEYFTGMNGIHEPVIHNTSYNLGVGYRQMVYKNWVFFELRPVASFLREYDYEYTPTLTAKIEVIFGGKKREGKS
ncbi:MAG: hypothetical protein VX399_07900 [SAR324 cluster bacterium]|nr:hypothetical protein [SAR324 cluster bacterium]